MPDPELKHESPKIRQLVDEFSRGELSVPEFQRDYVWRPSKAARLLDSLYRNYPISCLVAWESNSKVEYRNAQQARYRTLRWILDGQQRVRTLQKIRDGDLEIVFDVENERFMRANAATRDDRRWIRVDDIWRDDTYRELWSTATGLNATRLERVRNILENYAIPVITLQHHDFRAAVEIFQRINTQGVRLGSAEIQSAHVAEKHAGFMRQELIPFLNELKGRGFDRISSTHLFRVAEFIAHPDARNRVLLHQMDTGEVREAFKRTKRATNTALSLLENEFGLHDMKLLWSGSLLVPVICLCDQHVSKRNDKEIAGWLALAALHHRYSKSSDNMLDQDLRACRAEDPISALLSNIRGKRAGLLSGDYDFNRTTADRSTLFAAYVACHHLNAMDLITCGKIGSTVDRHHIFPRALLKGTPLTADEIANIAFISGDTNKSISATHPSIYLEKLAKTHHKVLRSQAIPMDPVLWHTEQAEAFWQRRRELLSQAFNAYVKSALPRRRL